MKVSPLELEISKDNHVKVLRERVSLLEEESKRLRSARFAVVSVSHCLGCVESIKCLFVFSTQNKANEYIKKKR